MSMQAAIGVVESYMRIRGADRIEAQSDLVRLIDAVLHAQRLAIVADVAAWKSSEASLRWAGKGKEYYEPPKGTGIAGTVESAPQVPTMKGSVPPKPGDPAGLTREDPPPVP